MFFRYLFCVILGYAVGSVVAAILISRIFFKDDVRLYGSGNSGATNAARTYGLGFGVLTFVFDFLKGLLACWLGRLIAGDAGLALAGFAAVIGHCFPAYFGFKGGKGVSVGAAFALMLDWRIFFAALILFIVLAAVTRIVSVGSITATACVGVLSLVIPENSLCRVMGLAAAITVIIMHRSNIVRLFRGEEKQMSFGKR